MDYKKKYEDALKRAKDVHTYYCDDREQLRKIESIFPELTESGDEKIKKGIKSILEHYKESGEVVCPYPFVSIDEALYWLEKQGKKPKKVSVWKHWKDGIAGNAEGKQIYLIKIGNIYSISSCLGCECDYIELSELDKLQRMEE